MDAPFQDYYKLLQVHVLAEPDMIKSAYLKLSKKYHPDGSKGNANEEKMKALNQAYAILSDQKMRDEYTIRWLREAENGNTYEQAAFTDEKPIPMEPVRSIMLQYLTALSEKEYITAYDCLSLADKKNIPLTEFTRWQMLVGEVFELLSFSCEVHSIQKNVTIQNRLYATCVSVHCTVSEENYLMERTEEDDFYKYLLFENNSWKIYLGYTSLKGIIDKFSSLAQLIRQKEDRAFLTRFVFMEKKEFLEMSQREQMRFNRYGSIFSMIICEISADAMDVFENILRHQLRKLDIACRWSLTTQLILLPQTSADEAVLVARKISKISGTFPEIKTQISYRILQQQFPTLDDLINRLQKVRPIDF